MNEKEVPCRNQNTRKQHQTQATENTRNANPPKKTTNNQIGHVIPPLSKTFFFAHHTLSQMSQAVLGLILETGPVSLLIRLPWFLLPPLAGRSCKPPMWARVGLRPVVGTTIDLKVQPPPLSEREKLLLLSCWQQWDPTGVQGSALSQWLVAVDVEHGSDGLDSPTFLKQNFDVQEAVHLYHEAHLGPLEDLFEVNGRN